MKDKMLTYDLGKRPQSELEYMVVLAEALGHSKAYLLAPEFSQVRWDMGQNGVFWKQTNFILKSLTRYFSYNQVFISR